MLGLAALILAAASQSQSPGLATASPWWEKVTYTMRDGAQQDCRYQSSFSSTGVENCGTDNSPETMRHSAGSSSGGYTKITVERRFTPYEQPHDVVLDAGERLLGGQVIEVAIDSGGAVRSCEIISVAGDMKPPFGCEEIRTERFDASAGGPVGRARHGYMTVLVYGHQEDLA